MNRKLILVILISLMCLPCWAGVVCDGDDSIGLNIHDDLAGKNIYTIQLWMSASSYATNAVGLSFGFGSDTSATLILYPYDSVNGNGFRVYFNTNSELDLNSQSIADGKPHSFVMVSRGALDREFYVDGVSVGTQTSFNDTISASSSSSFVCRWAGGQFGTGNVYQVDVWKAALNAQEVLQISKSLNKSIALQVQTTPSTNKLIQSLRFNEYPNGKLLNGLPFTDYSSIGNNSGNGSDGANNVGMTSVSEAKLNYP